MPRKETFNARNKGAIRIFLLMSSVKDPTGYFQRYPSVSRKFILEIPSEIPKKIPQKIPKKFPQEIHPEIHPKIHPEIHSYEVVKYFNSVKVT